MACSSSPSRCGLPDIDGALMVLMGLGQGAYLGKKLTVMTPIARLRALAPANGKPGDPITIYGASFGATQNGSLITLDGTPLADAPQTWQDTQIRFTIPNRHPNGIDWTKPQQVVD